MDFQLTQEQQEMVTENWGLVRYIVNELGIIIFGNDFDDMVSIGTMGLMKAAATFDSSENIKFSTYAGRCITNEVLMELRKKRRELLYLDEPICQDGDGNELTIMDTLSDSKTASFEDRIENAEVITQALNYVLNCFPRRDAVALLLSMAGVTQRDIANMVGISQPHVSRLIPKLHRKLKQNYGETDYQKVFTMALKDDRFEIKFSTADVGRFNEIIANSLADINDVENLQDFKVSCTSEQVVIYLPAEPESLAFIACIIRDIESFSMSFEGASQIPSKNDKKEDTASSTSSIIDQIREYILSKDSFSVSELKEKFPGQSVTINYVVNRAKKKGLIYSDTWGHYIVKK